MAQDIIIRGVTYPGVEKLNLATQGGIALFHDTSPADAVAGDIAVGKTAFVGSGLITGTKQPPTGSIPITENGLYDVTDYASALVNVSGGGGEEPFAVIGVTYPAGSVCICSKGATTLPAAGTGGSYPFLIPEAGTWTVSCTDPVTGETDSILVVIERQYEVKSAVLSYWTNQLYELGNEFVSVTGGWGTRAWRGESSWIAREPTVVKNADHMELTWSGSSGSTISSGALEILKDFDFTPYSKIELTYDKVIPSGGQLYAVVQNRTAADANVNALAILNIGYGTGTDIVSNINIASVSGSFDFALITRTFTTSSSIKIKKVLLF